MFTLLLTIFYLLTIYGVNGRICTCALFIDEQCNAQENCAWNTRESLGDIVKGNHGICRSTKWMECHKDELCSIEGRREMAIERTLEAEEEAAAQANGHTQKKRRRRRVLGVGMDDITAADLDWPYNCVNGQYGNDIMDIRPFQLLAFKSAGLELIQDNIETNAAFLTLSMAIKFIGIIIFCFMIGFAVCYKFKDPSYKAINEKEENYSTF